jgi:hypothetical protein
MKNPYDLDSMIKAFESGDMNERLFVDKLVENIRGIPYKRCLAAEVCLLSVMDWDVEMRNGVADALNMGEECMPPFYQAVDAAAKFQIEPINTLLGKVEEILILMGVTRKVLKKRRESLGGDFATALYHLDDELDASYLIGGAPGEHDLHAVLSGLAAHAGIDKQWQGVLYKSLADFVCQNRAQFDRGEFFATRVTRLARTETLVGRSNEELVPLGSNHRRDGLGTLRCIPVLQPKYFYTRRLSLLGTGRLNFGKLQVAGVGGCLHEEKEWSDLLSGKNCPGCWPGWGCYFCWGWAG